MTSATKSIICSLAGGVCMLGWASIGFLLLQIEYNHATPKGWFLSHGKWIAIALALCGVFLFQQTSSFDEEKDKEVRKGQKKL